MEPAQSHLQWIQGALLVEIKQLEHEADCVPPSSSEIEISCAPYFFVAWCLTVHYDFQAETEKLPTVNGVKPVSPEQEELIHRLVYFQNEYEQPSEEDLKRITVRVLEFRNLSLTYINNIFQVMLLNTRFETSAVTVYDEVF